MCRNCLCQRVNTSKNNVGNVNFFLKSLGKISYLGSLLFFFLTACKFTCLWEHLISEHSRGTCLCWVLGTPGGPGPSAGFKGAGAALVFSGVRWSERAVARGCPAWGFWRAEFIASFFWAKAIKWWSFPKLLVFVLKFSINYSSETKCRNWVTLTQNQPQFSWLPQLTVVSHTCRAVTPPVRS